MEKEPKYWHVGMFTLPEEKKEEFVDDLLKVMNAVGLRKSGTIERNGVSVRVSEPCSIAEDGKIYFDLALCGHEHLALSWMETADGQMHLAGEWLSEQCWYALVTVMALQEMYTSTPYYTTCRGEIIAIRGFANTLAYILKKEPHFLFRDDMARFLAFQYETGVKAREDDEDAGGWDDYSALVKRWLDLADSGCEDSFMGICVAYNGLPEKRAKEAETLEFKDRNYFEMTRWIMQAVSEGNGETRGAYKDFLDRLTQRPYAEREKLAVAGSPLYRNTAYASLKMHPVSLYGAYAKASGEDFWKLWTPRAQTAYDDWENASDRLNEDGERRLLPPYEFLRVLTEHGIGNYDRDEYLCLWDGETKLPEYTKEQLDEWENSYEETEDDGSDAEVAAARFLSHLASMQSDGFGMHPADTGMVKEFLANLGNPLYRRALCLWERDAYGDVDKFPELPPETVKRHIISRMDGWQTGKRADMFASLLADHRLRVEYFGF